jgi:cytochrome bd-type quinol oxidase subunit 2
MKRKVARWTCTNCGKIQKSNFVEFCPRCNARLTIKKLNYKQLAILTPIALFVVYLFMYLMFSKTGKMGSIETYEEFNILMIISAILSIVFLSIIFYSHKKRSKKDEEYSGHHKKAGMEIKKFEIELNDRLLGVLIISFIIIFPTILIPAYIDITNDGVLSSNQFLWPFIVILGIFVFILPFIIGYFAFHLPEKKLLEEH